MKPRKVDKILEELRKGTTLNKIRARFNDPKASLYEAFTIYFPEADQKCERKQLEIGSLESQIKVREEKVKSFNTEISERSQCVNKLKNEEKRLQNELENLKKAIEDERGELHGIDAKLLDFAKRGVTTELVTRIRNVEVGSG